MTWAQFEQRNIALAANAEFAFNLLGGLQNGSTNISLPTPTTGSTVLRTIVHVGLVWDGNSVENQLVNFGIRVARLNDIPANTMLPQDPTQDWLFYEQMIPGGGTNAGGAPVGVEGFSYDLRGKRRIHDASLTLGLGMQAVGNTNVIAAQVSIRTLLKLA